MKPCLEHLEPRLLLAYGAIPYPSHEAEIGSVMPGLAGEVAPNGNGPGPDHFHVRFDGDHSLNDLQAESLAVGAPAVIVPPGTYAPQNTPAASNTTNPGADAGAPSSVSAAAWADPSKYAGAAWAEMQGPPQIGDPEPVGRETIAGPVGLPFTGPVSVLDLPSAESAPDPYTVHMMPDSGMLAIRGSFDANHSERLITLPIGEDDTGVELFVGPVSPSAQFRAEIFAGEGNGPLTTLGESGPAPEGGYGAWTNGARAGASYDPGPRRGFPPFVTVRLDDMSNPGAALSAEESGGTVGVDASAAGSSSAASDASDTTANDFIVYVYFTRQAAQSVTASDTASLLPGMSSSSISATQPIGSSSDSPTAPAGSESSAGAEAEPSSVEAQWQSGSTLVATGPLPSRSSSAIGGVLASGDPVPLVDGRDAAVVDLALLGLAGDDEEPVDTVTIPLTTNAEPAEVIADAVGISLLGSSLTDFTQASARRKLPGVDALAREQVAAKESAEATESHRPTTETESLAAVTLDPSSLARTARRVSILTGVSLAVVSTVGMVLPEFCRPHRGRSGLKSSVRRWLRARRSRPTV